MGRGLNHQEFAKDWVDSWNAHDLARILAHYDEDVVLVSPRARSIYGKADATVRGKAELEDYFSRALRRLPDLRFTLETSFGGEGSVVVQYRSYNGQPAAEFMAFAPNGLVSRVVAHYAE